MAQEAPLVVVPLPEPDETPEDGEMPEDEELLDDEPELEEDEPADDEPDADLLDDDLLDDEPAAEDFDDLADEAPEVAFFAVDECVPVLVLLCPADAAEAWVVCAPTTAAVAVAAVAASAVVQVIFLTRRRPAVLAWTACRKWELVMGTDKPARF